MTQRPPFSLGPQVQIFLREGYHWSDRIGGYVRIEVEEWPTIVVDLAPADGMPAERFAAYYVWWERGEDLLMRFSVLRMIKRVKRPFYLVLHDDGDLLFNARTAP